MATSLVQKILELASDLTAGERDNLKLILGEAAGGLASDGKLPEEQEKGSTFRTVLACLARLQPHANRVPSDGIAFHGRPPIITDDLLSALIAESRSRRKDAIREGGYLLGCGGPVADKLAVSPQLIDFVEQHAGPVTPTAIASYLYYEEPGQGLDPHVDTDVFSVNLILMLQHEFSGDSPSHLVIYPAELDPTRILLRPGDVTLLYADCIVHAREPVKQNEVVNLLTIGFQPVGQ